MQSPTREEMMKLWMYDTVVDVQEKNDAVTDAKKKNDTSCKCTMQLQMYKKRMLKNKLQKGDVKIKYVPIEEQVADVSTNPLSHVKFEYFETRFVQSESTSLKRGSDGRWKTYRKLPYTGYK